MAPPQSLVMCSAVLLVPGLVGVESIGSCRVRLSRDDLEVWVSLSAERRMKLHPCEPHAFEERPVLVVGERGERLGVPIDVACIGIEDEEA